MRGLKEWTLITKKERKGRNLKNEGDFDETYLNETKLGS